jgi:hypothetical protein
MGHLDVLRMLCSNSALYADEEACRAELVI